MPVKLLVNKCEVRGARCEIRDARRHSRGKKVSVDATNAHSSRTVVRDGSSTMVGGQLESRK